MEAGIEADNVPKCECILSNFLNVLQRVAPESEIPKSGFKSKETVTEENTVSYNMQNLECVLLFHNLQSVMFTSL